MPYTKESRWSNSDIASKFGIHPNRIFPEIRDLNVRWTEAHPADEPPFRITRQNDVHYYQMEDAFADRVRAGDPEIVGFWNVPEGDDGADK
jgi:hypothetical protein